MDKNTVIGLLLIFLVIIGFSWLNRPSEEELARQQHVRDSIAAVKADAVARQMEAERERARQDSLAAIGEGVMDSARLESKYGVFASSAIGIERLDTIENGKLRMVFTNKGGRVKSVEIVGQLRYDKKPYKLFEGDEATSNFTFITRNRVINTKDLFFTPIISKKDTATTLTMRLAADSASWIDFTYSIPKDEYMTSMAIKAHNMDDILAQNVQSIDVQMQQLVRQNEKGRRFELRYSALNYKYTADDVEDLSDGKSEREQLKGKINWVAFKDHFFSQIIIAKESFTSTEVESEVMPENSQFIRNHKMNASLPFYPKGEKATVISTYYGPNQYKVLRAYDDGVENEDDELELYKIIPMGWKIFSWISTLIIIPLFNFLGNWFTNYGIIILLMTIIVKICVFPLMWKPLMSSAKMRILRPEIEKINQRIPADKPMERQQATMALYSKAGASPLNGCVPMLLQWPVLFAMFSFFPTCFELRGQSFLWAEDLSSYDAIVSWNTYIPIITPYFGNHISLFCLLMTIVNIVYTKLNMAGQASNDQSAKMMKWMMYLMPLMFMFMFNNYSSGLSYYYFISLLITILQTYMFRLFVDEKKVMESIKKAESKPSKKKPGFMARLEAAQRAQQEAMRKQMEERQRKQMGGKGRH
ncbi:MAG: membrane protein insertase YidC [Paludibacteraceae bacterium]|nr:membrane protein insertase YidC [Paludibacteraceae bacterium]